MIYEYVTAEDDVIDERDAQGVECWHGECPKGWRVVSVANPRLGVLLVVVEPYDEKDNQ